MSQQQYCQWLAGSPSLIAAEMNPKPGGLVATSRGLARTRLRCRDLEIRASAATSKPHLVFAVHLSYKREYERRPTWCFRGAGASRGPRPWRRSLRHGCARSPRARDIPFAVARACVHGAGSTGSERTRPFDDRGWDAETRWPQPAGVHAHCRWESRADIIAADPHASVRPRTDGARPESIVSARPPSAWLAIARRLVAPGQREEAEGDLIELWARVTERGNRASALRFWRDAFSLAIASRRRLEDDFAQDVRHGFRLVRRLPGLALAACTSLAIGIGGTTAAFTMIDAALLRPWPYPEADRLMVLSTNLGRYFSPPAFRRLSDRHDGLDHLTATQAHGFLMSFGGQAVLVNGHRVSAEAVALLGLNGALHPEVGRAFVPSEFAPDSEPV